MTEKDTSFDNTTESHDVAGDRYESTYTSNTDQDNSRRTGHVTGGSHNQHSFDTPNILLEQLAYMDTFMPTMGQNFVNSGLLSYSNSGPNLGSILLQNENENGTVGGDGNGNDSNSQTNGSGTGFEFSLDEQLALELSAFADEDFVFAGEEKPRDPSNTSDNSNNNNNNNNVDSNNVDTYHNRQNEENGERTSHEEQEPNDRDNSEPPRVNKATKKLTFFDTEKEHFSNISVRSIQIEVFINERV